MTQDLPLFDRPQPERRPSIEERFRVWIGAHPEVVDLMRTLALQAIAAGRKRIGMAALFEVARWHLEMSAPERGFKLNNDFRALMSRHLVVIEPRLEGAFELRERRTA